MKTKIFLFFFMCCLFSCQDKEFKNKEKHIESIRVLTIEGDTVTIHSRVVNGWTGERSITIK